MRRTRCFPRELPGNVGIPQLRFALELFLNLFHADPVLERGTPADAELQAYYQIERRPGFYYFYVRGEQDRW